MACLFPEPLPVTRPAPARRGRPTIRSAVDPERRRCGDLPNRGFRRDTLEPLSTPRAAGPIAALTALVVASLVAAGPAERSTPPPVADVVVQSLPGAAGTAERAVARLGGQVTRRLTIVDGFAASLPRTAVDDLQRADGVRAVTEDRRMTVQGDLDPVLGTSVYPKVVRADDTWRAGSTGRGVTVAVVDTGVAPVADLGGRIVPVSDPLTGATTPCQNLSGEAGCQDSYGHGTFVAGIVAGNGAASGGRYRGIAPEANVVSVKVAGRDGSADVSTVLAAIQWVVSFRDQYGIRVLNLSLGTDSTETYRLDPLNYAVERAWAAGVTVVVSASNRGPAPGTISKPGDDPFVITVGALDDRGTPGLGDDRLPDYSSRGPTADGLAKPDVVAPGARLVSLRSPGSAVDTAFPNAGDGAYRRGSGTSMATAVVSGVAALVHQARPELGPDGAKHALRATARPAASADALAVGAGVVDALAASAAAPMVAAAQALPRSTGRGSLDASRGSVRARAGDPFRTVIAGALTAQLLLWDPVGYTTYDWDARTWMVTPWYAGRWYGTSWYGNNWHGNNWHGSSFYGSHDDDSYGQPWHGAAWYGSWG